MLMSYTKIVPNAFVRNSILGFGTAVDPGAVLRAEAIEMTNDQPSAVLLKYAMDLGGSLAQWSELRDQIRHPHRIPDCLSGGHGGSRDVSLRAEHILQLTLGTNHSMRTAVSLRFVSENVD